MKNLWSDSDAKAAIDAHAKKGIGEDLALRVYTTRLLGGEPRLVLHGGGNTSVKTRMADITGTTIDVLCVKGSGWDMGTIEAPGLPAVRRRGWAPRRAPARRARGPAVRVAGTPRSALPLPQKRQPTHQEANFFF